MDIQNGFMFFRSYWEAAEMLTSDEERSQYLLAVCQYAFTGQVQELKGTPAAMFALTKPNLDVSRARAAAGSKKKQAKNQTENKTESKQNQKCTERIKEEDTGKGKDSSNDQAFDEFWKLYPKKKSKGQARKVWDRLKPDAQTISAIMEKLPELIQSDDWKREGGQYIPYPATWLNAEGWSDEVTKKSATSKTNSHKDFEQRDYDYAALEKKLFQKSMKRKA